MVTLAEFGRGLLALGVSLTYNDDDVGKSQDSCAVSKGPAIDRREVFNLLNTPNLGTPNAVRGTAHFGTITTAFDPRVVRLAMKFVF